MTKLTNASILLISLIQAGCSVVGIRSEENPKYDLVLVRDNKEIRSYSSLILARTKVKGEFKEAQNKAFRILAGYIFGANEKKENISSSTPVTRIEASESEKIAMTAPVFQHHSDDGWTMSFMMPSKYSLTDLPKPKDNRIFFEEMAPKIFGVIRFSGRWKESTNEEMAKILKDWIKENEKYEMASEPIFAAYDPPWTIPFLRRNEILIELKAKK
jgi:hypothetical protein